jgi:plasmid replication initiation protein
MEKEKNKIFLCDDYIITSKKQYSINQLRLFYHLLYKFREINYFQNNLEFSEIIEDTIELENTEVQKIFIQSRYTELDIQDLIESIPDHIILIDKNGIDVVKLYIFDYIQYMKFDCAIFKFNQECFRYINNIYQNFSKLNLNDFNLLKSKYSQRLYELSCKFDNQKYYTMPIDTFRNFFKIENKYINAEINRYILKTAINEINEKTSKFIIAETVKKNNKLTHIKFIFN